MSEPRVEDFMLNDGSPNRAAHIAAMIRHHYDADHCPRGSITAAEAILSAYAVSPIPATAEGGELGAQEASTTDSVTSPGTNNERPKP